MATTRKAVLPVKHDDSSNISGSNSNSMRYNRAAASRSGSRTTSILSAAASLGIVVLVFFIMWDSSTPRQAPPLAPVLPTTPVTPTAPAVPAVSTASAAAGVSPPADPYQTDARGCYHSIPAEDPLPHIVSPPEGAVTLVCCQTTLGARPADPARSVVLL